jgi:hypothetical protein
MAMAHTQAILEIFRPDWLRKFVKCINYLSIYSSLGLVASGAAIGRVHDVRQDSGISELDSHHELKLPRQSGTRVRGSVVVVVVVEVVERTDNPEVCVRR